MIIKKIHTISYYTFKELLKSKILLNVFFVGLALVVVTFVATEFTYGVPERVALDFGLGMLSISTLAISLLLGVNLLSKEIESRTVYMVISRPVPRYAFILGKLLGLLQIQFLNVILLGSMTLASVYFLGGELSSLIYWSILFIFLEAALLLFVTVFISLITNNILSAILALVILVLGHAVKETQNVSMVVSHPWIKSVLEAYHFALPGFYKLNIKEFVLYNSTLPNEYLFSSLVYGLTYSVFLLLMIVFVFNRKSID